MHKLDPEITHYLSLLEQLKSDDEALRHNAEQLVDLEKPINVAIVFEGDIEDLRDVGYEPGSTRKNITYGICRWSDLKELAEHPNVIKIEKQRKVVPQLDNSVPDIKADQIWSRSGNNFSGYTGEGTIVGIIDTGIDFRHGSFRNADGTTRILRIWDQTLNTSGHPGEAVPSAIPGNTIGPYPLGYGVEYTEAQINDTLTQTSPSVPVRHRDEHGHGTHVAGIAAGNGKQPGGCRGEYNYIGVAPKAEIIAVRLFGLTASDSDLTAPSTTSRVMDALAYIFQQANNFGKPATVNCSFGSFTDEMDGSSILCQNMNNLLIDNYTGFSIVFAAGNEGNSKFHATATVPAGGIVGLIFQLSPDDGKTRQISVLYPGNDLRARFTSPSDKTIPWTTSGNENNNNNANGTSGVVTLSNKKDGNDRILLTIVPPSGGNNLSGDWILELSNTGASPTDINAFCLYGSTHDRKSPYFLDHTTVQATLSVQATASEVVSVGSYKVSDGELATSSGRGPTLDGRKKPEITAPGVGIWSAAIESARNDDPGDACVACCCECCQDFYVTKSGTSMAAPHVAGAIALIMQKNDALNYLTIKNLLEDNAQAIPSGASEDDRAGWGEGKLDAKASVDATTAAPGSTPSSGGGATPIVTHQPDPVGVLRDTVLNSPRGMAYNRLFKEHVEEIRYLVNTNKKVATVWHRNRGPAWFRVGLQSVYYPDRPLPEELDGASLSKGIWKMFAILKRFGTQDLVKTLNSIETDLKKIRDGMTINQFVHLVTGESLVYEEMEINS